LENGGAVNQSGTTTKKQLKVVSSLESQTNTYLRKYDTAAVEHHRQQLIQSKSVKRIV